MTIHDSDNPLTPVKDPIHLMGVAIRDMRNFKRKASTDKKLKFDVKAWHRVQSGVCYACVAGAVMAGTLEVPDDRSMWPCQFDSYTQNKLFLLDALRMKKPGESGKITALIKIDLEWDARWARICLEAIDSLTFRQRCKWWRGHITYWSMVRSRMIQLADKAGLTYERLEDEDTRQSRP